VGMERTDMHCESLRPQSHVGGAPSCPSLKLEANTGAIRNTWQTRYLFDSIPTSLTARTDGRPDFGFLQVPRVLETPHSNRPWRAYCRPFQGISRLERQHSLVLQTPSSQYTQGLNLARLNSDLTWRTSILKQARPYAEDHLVTSKRAR
jgi:hypothetical protein